VDDGMLLLDAYGGSDAFREIEEKREEKGFTYVWDQHFFNPLTGHVINHIHFRFRDGTRLERAFTYEWRLWTLPELTELLREAGFRDVTVYWEGSEKSGEGNGVHLWTSADASVIGCDASGFQDAIYLSFAHGARIERGRFHYNGRYGLHTMYCRGAVLRDNQFDRNVAGIAIMFSNGLEVTGNRVFDLQIALCAFEGGAREIIRILVADTGVGIPSELLPHIFDPFFTTKEKGTGLGMAIAHRIIEDHLGTIEVSSRVGEGTTFTLTLPVQAGGVEVRAAPPPEAIAAPPLQQPAASASSPSTAAPAPTV